MIVLGIETSCDETSAALIETPPAFPSTERGPSATVGNEIRLKLLSNVVSSQADLHRRWGGVVPEVASRAHLAALYPVVEEALLEAGLPDYDLIAVTQGPGLLGSLVCGISYAKSLALSRRLPIVAVDHLESHIFAVSLQTDFPTLLPAVALIASGGHSDLYYVSQDLTLKLIGCTRDDAAGEAFDKGARALGLGYPGGPAIDKCARAAHPPYPTFPIPSLGVEYSFSGIKTALVRFVERGMEGFSVEQAAFAYQEAICRQLVAGCRAALQQTAAGTLIVCGGVAANSRLRQMARELTDELAVRLAIPPLELCTDNAAMIAARGWFVFRSRGADSLRFDAYATSRIL